MFILEDVCEHVNIQWHEILLGYKRPRGSLVFYRVRDDRSNRAGLEAIETNGEETKNLVQQQWTPFLG